MSTPITSAVETSPNPTITVPPASTSSLNAVETEKHIPSFLYSRDKHGAPKWRLQGLRGYTLDEFEEAVRNGTYERNVINTHKRIAERTGITAIDFDTPLPVAYRQFEPFVKQITPDIRIRFSQRHGNGMAELIVEDNNGVPRRLPENLEVVSCVDGLRLPAEDRDFVYKKCVYSFCKNSRYAIRDIATGKILCQLGFDWEVRRL